MAVTTCGAADYVLHTLRTLRANATRPHLVAVIDDASDVPARITGAGLVDIEVGFPARGGLLRSWNAAYTIALDAECDGLAILNSDLHFPKGWDADLDAASMGCDFFGPLTNAPGPDLEQHVRTAIPDYVFPFTSADADRWQARLAADRLTVRPGKFNGFAFFGRVDAFRANEFQPRVAFNPNNAFNSRGQPNPTPTMTLGEYEFQRRAAVNGLRCGVAAGMFLVHFRSASRGAKHRQGDAIRLEDWK